MLLVKSKEAEVGQTNEDRARSVVQTYQAKPVERDDPWLNLVQRTPHLDVDAVLARSLPKLTGE